MLGMKNYTQEYIDGCRSKVDSDVATYRSLVTAARNHSASDVTPLTAAIQAFEAAFFNNMLLILDGLFVNRLRIVEGKDGNPLNEVRVLCNSVQNNKNIMTAENVSAMTAFAGLKAMKLSPTTSVLKHKTGDEIKLSEADFQLLAQAFFVELERRFV